MSPLRYLRELVTAEWKPVPAWSAWAWVGFYVLFLWYAFTQRGAYLFIDSANLVVHEAGHLLFGWFGPTLGVWGGTILQWAVPLALAAYFFWQRQLAATAFCLFFFFENWLYTAIYMADARAMNLPLVTVGDPDMAEHDWSAIFSSLGLLEYDTRIAGLVRLLGWCGMVGTVAWFVMTAIMTWKTQADGVWKVVIDAANSSPGPDENRPDHSRIPR